MKGGSASFLKKNDTINTVNKSIHNIEKILCELYFIVVELYNLCTRYVYVGSYILVLNVMFHYLVF